MKYNVDCYEAIGREEGEKEKEREREREKGEMYVYVEKKRNNKTDKEDNKKAVKGREKGGGSRSKMKTDSERVARRGPGIPGTRYP
jgi:hypothetical protein